MKDNPPRIGTAGWTVPARYTGQFPRSGSHLSRYAQRLNAVEINSSFYRPHKRTTYQRWSESVPQDFLFAVKAPKAVTHAQRLENCGDLLTRFMSEVEGLGNKLGVLLVQLPPSLIFDVQVAKAFFQDLRNQTGTAVACEPRHVSWFDGRADEILEKLGVARVAADPPPAVGADEPGGWGGLAYYRLHGAPRVYYSDYGDAALQAIKAKLERCSAARMAAWCIFDNTAAFAATGNALEVASA
jgi:uncharacterized protein YecE (DUF72 family)